MTQADLGRCLGVSQPQIARWEAAVYRNVTLERVGAVAEALGVGTQLPDLPIAAEAPAAYATALPGAEPEALRALARTGAPPAAVAAFARSHNIERLDLFGSVLGPDFGPGSDIDVLVTYDHDAAPSLFDLTDHETELAAILGRATDLVSRPGIERSENYLRRRKILAEARTLYARP